MKKEIKFAPGCFDSFDGSQEELNDLMKEIMELIQSEGFEDAEIYMIHEDDINLEDLDNMITPAKRILQ